mgnify:CR=1 FL=1
MTYKAPPLGYKVITLYFAVNRIKTLIKLKNSKKRRNTIVSPFVVFLSFILTKQFC